MIAEELARCLSSAEGGVRVLDLGSFFLGEGEVRFMAGPSLRAALGHPFSAASRPGKVDFSAWLASRAPKEEEQLVGWCFRVVDDLKYAKQWCDPSVGTMRIAYEVQGVPGRTATAPAVSLVFEPSAEFLSNLNRSE